MATISIFTLSHGMLQPVSAHTQKFFNQALDAFKIPKESIKILHDPTLNSIAIAQAEANRILINDKDLEDKDDAVCTYVAFHEVGHIVDHAQHPWKTFNNYWGTYLGVSIPLLATLNKLTFNKKIKFPSWGLACLVVNLGLTFALSLAATEYRKKYIIAQGEHAANLLACNKLIEHSKLDPVGCCLVFFKQHELYGPERIDPSHPLAKEEYAVVEKSLNAQHYYLSYTKKIKNDKNILKLKITKDSIVVSQVRSESKLGK